MPTPYPGLRARERCAQRTRDELAEVSFSRDLSERDTRRFAWMAARCETCAACPLTIRALRVMVPKAPETPRDNVVAFRLAS